MIKYHDLVVDWFGYVGYVSKVYIQVKFIFAAIKTVIMGDMFLRE